MKLIDKLLLSMSRPGEMLEVALIGFDDNNRLYGLRPLVWNGKPGQGRTLEPSYHATEALARAELERLGELYSSRDCVVIVDDLGVT